jgi:hypothetical protein
MRKLLLILLVLSFPSVAIAAGPFARAAVENKGSIVPGQQMRLDVDILVPDFFTSPPQFPLFDIPNALVTLPDERASNFTETVDGVQYSGIRRAYAIIPQAAGKFAIPEIEVDLGYSVDGHPTKATVKVPSVAFEVAAPATPTAPAGDTISFVASELTIKQSFDRDLHSLKVGDALVRTITISAGDTQAMVMPAVAAGTTEGLRQYAKAPRIEDGVSEGRDTISRRTETYVYTAEKSGSFVIPAIAYPWLDPADHQAKTATLPSVPLVIADATSETAIRPVLDKAAPQSPWIRRRKIAAGILAALALLAVAYLARSIPSALVRMVALARLRHSTSPGHRLRQLRRTIATAKEKEIYQGLHAWSRSLGYKTLEAWAADGSDDLKRQVEALAEGLFGGGRRQLDRTVLARNVVLRSRVSGHTSSPLPPLNPTCRSIRTVQETPAP